MLGISDRRTFIILTYHRVVPKPDPLRPAQIDGAAFMRQMKVLHRYFNVLSLQDAYARLHNRSLPPRSVVITFDDGYADNSHIAFPILQRFGLPATFFIATDYLNGGRMWNDTIIEAVRRSPLDHVDLGFLGMEHLDISHNGGRRQAIVNVIQKLKYLPVQERNLNADKVASALKSPTLPTNMMMTDEELRHLYSRGMEIGGHTATHPILSQLAEGDARKEIVNGQNYLAECVNAKISSFAYPNGMPKQDYQASHVAMVRDAGFDLAVSTAWGPVRAADDDLQLPRVGFTESRTIKLCLQMLRAYSDPEAIRA